VYSLGASLFELLTESRARTDRARAMQDAAVPEPFSDLLLAAMSATPEERPDAKTFAESLNRIADELRSPAAEEIAKHAPPPSQVTRRDTDGG
jgi:hypothetical protein